MSVVFGVIETFKIIGYYSILMSYKTGQIIVQGLINFTIFANKLLSTLYTVLVILNEDLLVFLRDVWNRFNCILDGLNSGVNYIGDFIINVVNFIQFIVFGTSDVVILVAETILGVITKVLTTIGNGIAGLKHLLVLFGSGVWFAVTLIPVFIVYVCMMITYYTGRAFNELSAILSAFINNTRNGFKELLAFVTDFPFESIAGLLVSVCVSYVVIKCHLALLSQLLRVIQWAKLKISSLSLPEWRQKSNDTELHRVQANREPIAEKRLCIICLEVEKCILYLPCRHLCTCVNCNAQLETHSERCPICRTYIECRIRVY